MGLRGGWLKGGKTERSDRDIVLSIDNSTLSILYPTFAFLLKLPRLHSRGTEGPGMESDWGRRTGGGTEGALKLSFHHTSPIDGQHITT